MLAGENDLELLEKTKEGRNINRHYYSKEEVAENWERPVVQKLRNLMEFRSHCEAFDGECRCSCQADHICIERIGETCIAVLEADLTSYTFKIIVKDKGTNKEKMILI